MDEKEEIEIVHGSTGCQHSFLENKLAAISRNQFVLFKKLNRIEARLNLRVESSIQLSNEQIANMNDEELEKILAAVQSNNEKLLAFIQDNK